jgi:NAD(P)-dependent dehydrogenase (short-subunit alcohol dehydrogenase family)
MSAPRQIVVTGGASGIGVAIARRFAASGDRLIVVDVNTEAGLAAARELGGDAVFRPLDVADEQAVDGFAAALDAEIGAPSVLVNSAGLLQNASSTHDMAMDEHDRIWAVNYRGSYLMCRAFANRMAEGGGGAILNIASINAYIPLPLPAYNPTKVAIHGLTRMLAAEYGPRNVRVNAVAPGFTLTPAMQARIDSGHRNPAAMEELSALGRMVLPEDVAEAAFFLCSDAAAAITGVDLPVDCGNLAALSYKAYPAS